MKDDKREEEIIKRMKKCKWEKKNEVDKEREKEMNKLNKEREKRFLKKWTNKRIKENDIRKEKKI